MPSAPRDSPRTRRRRNSSASTSRPSTWYTPTPRARAAAALAAASAPYEEIPRLDLAAVAAATGHRSEASRIIRDEVCNRSDDGTPPVELSERTEQILGAHGWPLRIKSAS